MSVILDYLNIIGFAAFWGIGLRWGFWIYDEIRKLICEVRHLFRRPR